MGAVLLAGTVVSPATRTSLDGAVDGAAGYGNADPAFENFCHEEFACRDPVYPDSANKPAALERAPARTALMARYDAEILARLFIVGTVIEGLIGRTKPENSKPRPALSSAQPLSAEHGSKRRAEVRASADR